MIIYKELGEVPYNVLVAIYNQLASWSVENTTESKQEILERAHQFVIEGMMLIRH